MIRYLALGNGVWLDEIRRDGVETVKDVPGGSVAFGVLGARMVAAEWPEAIGLIFNAGYDFPDAVVKIFESWEMSLTVRHRSGKPSSRGLVFYDKANDDRKGFQRLTDPLPVFMRDLQSTAAMQSTAFHFFGTAEYIVEQMSDLRKLREADPATTSGKDPLVIWEPHAKSCRPETLEAHCGACQVVDVFSPNHLELADFFHHCVGSVFDKAVVERQAQTFLDAGIGSSCAGAVVVRCAGHGCLVQSQNTGPTWLPSYYSSESSKVVDATGAGNAFLGAFAIGWQETNDFVEAAKYGQVAASFTIEQVGLPTRTGRADHEMWNGVRVRDRLAAYQQTFK